MIVVFESIEVLTMITAVIIVIDLFIVMYRELHCALFKLAPLFIASLADILLRCLRDFN